MDIDIDFKSSFDPLTIFDGVRASMIKDGKLLKHPAGVYFQGMARDPVTGLAAVPYDKAEELGYFKIDFLHLSILDNFNSKDEIRRLIKLAPDWKLLERREIVEHLFQIKNHFDTINKVKPKSVQELADCLALLRPGKKHLIIDYLNNPNDTRNELYKKPEQGQYYFKKGHAVSYALTIVLQLHLIKGNIL